MTTFSPGTVFGNSIKKVVASDRVDEHGNTIWINEGTGMECIVWDGTLYTLAMAPKCAKWSAERHAQELLAALQAMVDCYADTLPVTGTERPVVRQAREVIRKATGYDNQ